MIQGVYDYGGKEEGGEGEKQRKGDDGLGRICVS